MKINADVLEMPRAYLFSEVSRRISERGGDVIRMDIGDVTLPLPKVVTDAMRTACGELSRADTFRGYGGERGYPFLRRSVSQYYLARNVNVPEERIYINDGAKEELFSLLSLFSPDASALIPDPVYPAYADASSVFGRRVVYADATRENGFLPRADECPDADVIYICSPNNPTGAVYDKRTLSEWVKRANSAGSVIIFDAAYAEFVSDAYAPRSIYEIDGAENCAIETGSFSKFAGFTGVRCGWTVIPPESAISGAYSRIKSIRSNGVSYVTQRGAEAALSNVGMSANAKNVAYYKDNARVISETLSKTGIEYYGGDNSPYVWFAVPCAIGSWDFFDLLLSHGVSGTPGDGFGRNGKGMFRFSAFNSRGNTVEAMRRFKEAINRI